jgi:hypothetical protein
MKPVDLFQVRLNLKNARELEQADEKIFFDIMNEAIALREAKERILQEISEKGETRKLKADLEMIEKKLGEWRERSKESGRRLAESTKTREYLEEQVKRNQEAVENKKRMQALKRQNQANLIPNEQAAVDLPSERLETTISSQPNAELVASMPTGEEIANRTFNVSHDSGVSSRPSSRPLSRPSSRPLERLSSRPSERLSSRPSERLSSRPSERLSSRPSDRLSSRPSDRLSSRPSTSPRSPLVLNQTIDVSRGEVQPSSNVESNEIHDQRSLRDITSVKQSRKSKFEQRLLRINSNLSKKEALHGRILDILARGNVKTAIFYLKELSEIEEDLIRSRNARNQLIAKIQKPESRDITSIFRELEGIQRDKRNYERNIEQLKTEVEAGKRAERSLQEFERKLADANKIYLGMIRSLEEKLSDVANNIHNFSVRDVQTANQALEDLKNFSLGKR